MTQDSHPHTWHTDEVALQRYADGTALAVPGASVEAHLMVCSGCRERLGSLMPAEPLDEVWNAIRADVEAPGRSVLERWLGRLGISGESARLLAAVPAFRGAWLLGMLGITMFVGAAASLSEVLGLSLFLLIAPLAPVAGVAASFGGDADPSHELVTVTPYSTMRLLLLRSAGVMVTSVPAAILVGLALPGEGWLAAAWLAPAAAGVTLTLALAPTLGSTAAAATVGGAWSVVVVSAVRAHEPLALVEPATQLVLAALAAAAAMSVVLRYRSFDQLGRQL